jgi:hypothetical protein
LEQIYIGFLNAAWRTSYSPLNTSFRSLPREVT